MEESAQDNQHFMALVISISHAAMQQMGKIVNPITNKIERNLEQAQVSIDMLAMLRDKTKGNLTKKEEQLINETLMTCELTYADENKRT